MAKHKNTTKETVLARIKKYHDLGKRLPSTAWTKEQLIHLDLLVNECAICKCNGTWEGKPLVFHLDHIDGNATNNILYERIGSI